MPKLWIALFVIGGIAAVYVIGKKSPVVDSDGLDSPYHKGGPLDDGVYFKKYSGDGLMGSTSYLRLLDVNKANFEIATIKLDNPGGENNTLKLGKSGNRYFLGELPLPFNLEEEPLRRANRDRSRGPILYITEKRVFFLAQGSLAELSGVNPKTFWPVEIPAMSYTTNYCKDEKVVMFFKDDFVSAPQFVIVEGADPQTFKQIKTDYAMDKSKSYFREKIDANGPLVKIDDVYSKNAKAVFYYESPVRGADAGTFQVIGHGFSRDETHLFYNDTLVPGFDPKSFRFLSHREDLRKDASYIADKGAVYFNTRLNTTFVAVAEADAASFQDLDHSFGTDRSHVFYRGKILKDVDREGFEVLFENFPMGFYVKNSSQVYTVNQDQQLVKVENADAKTFVALKPDFVIRGKQDAEDARHYFFDGKVTKKK
ncbi:MAG: DKNYY domain-containing protein [Bdellovibrionales bacterium]|nr:DKNYY domain-containing protein [Bdellovibrionales bacterium]